MGIKVESCNEAIRRQIEARLIRTPGSHWWIGDKCRICLVAKKDGFGDPCPGLKNFGEPQGSVTGTPEPARLPQKGFGPKSAGGNKQTLNLAARAKPRMNQVERRLFEVLKVRWPDSHITPQFRLRISAWDAPVVVHYTADFLVAASYRSSGRGDLWWNFVLYEVKDKRRRGHSDELTRPKLARIHNPFISAVVLVTWDGCSWDERIIA